VEVVNRFIQDDINYIKDIPSILMHGPPDTAQSQWLSVETNGLAMKELMNIQVPTIMIFTLNTAFADDRGQSVSGFRDVAN
jgi:hypothetical protein